MWALAVRWSPGVHFERHSSAWRVRPCLPGTAANWRLYPSSWLIVVSPLDGELRQGQGCVLSPASSTLPAQTDQASEINVGGTLWIVLWDRLGHLGET